MKNFIEQEYHPVIEDFLSEYIEDSLGPVERETFNEVLVEDDNLRELAFHAKGGKQLMEKFAEVKKIKARDGFLNRLRDRIAEEQKC